jgi:hypothetical protein
MYNSDIRLIWYQIDLLCLRLTFIFEVACQLSPFPDLGAYSRNLAL